MLKPECSTKLCLMLAMGFSVLGRAIRAIVFATGITLLALAGTLALPIVRGHASTGNSQGLFASGIANLRDTSNTSGLSALRERNDCHGILCPRPTPDGVAVVDMSDVMGNARGSEGAAGSARFVTPPKR